MASIGGWMQERIDLKAVRRGLFDREMPGGLTWWHTLGSATLAVFTLQVVTGSVLAMYYSPSPDHAYDSVRYIDHSVLSGALLRGMHHWGASAMVVLVIAHLIRVFSTGAYKYPREINWLVGIVLLMIVLGFGFTGYLLPWDQKAYWATQVGTSIAGTTPLIGRMLGSILRGGTQLGAATLTRFYALHVLLFPLLLGGLILLHLAIVVRQGIAPRAPALETDAPPRTSDPGYASYYQERYKKSKGSGVRFWPDIIAKDVVVATAVILVIFLLAWYQGASLEAPADPTDTSYVPRPEWYFLPFFQLLKLVPGSLESAVAVGVPGAIVIVLIALPFFDRRSVRSLRHRPGAAVSLGALLAGAALLTGASFKATMTPANVALAEVGRPLTSVERAGRAQFQSQSCGSCHAVGAHKPDKTADVPDAPDLTEIGLLHSTAWLHSYIEDPMRFHKDSKMPAYGPPVLSHQEIEELARYLTALRGGPKGLMLQPEYRDTFPEPVKRH